MVLAGHDCRAAESVHGVRNPLIVGGNHDGIDERRERRPPVNVFHHRRACDLRQRFAWKPR
jgi:hypothetical protein